MITTAKQAKAVGLAWLKLEFRHSEGSKHTLSGPFTETHARDVFLCATRADRGDLRPGDAFDDNGPKPDQAPPAPCDHGSETGCVIRDEPAPAVPAFGKHSYVEGFTKTDLEKLEEALSDMHCGLSRLKQEAFLGHFNELAIFLQAAKAVAPDAKEKVS